MKFDFALILTVLTLLCGAFWLVDKLVLAKRRGPEGKPNDTVDFFASLFPVLAVVLCLRSFVYEPFRIPSSSMMPTLLIGDFILVNKFAYGVRLPVTNTVLFETGTPSAAMWWCSAIPAATRRWPATRRSAPTTSSA